MSETHRPRPILRRSGAKALTEMLPRAQYRSLEGLNHAAIVIAPKALADAMEQFFLDRN
jgi:hypothetical protein